jgi:hypothetical protein
MELRLIQWVPWDLSPGVKWLGREAGHSSPSSAKVKECVEIYLHSPNTPSWRGARLKKAQGQLYLYLYLRLKEISEFLLIFIYDKVSLMCLKQKFIAGRKFEFKTSCGPKRQHENRFKVLHDLRSLSNLVTTETSLKRNRKNVIHMRRWSKQERIQWF